MIFFLFNFLLKWKTRRHKNLITFRKLEGNYTFEQLLFFSSALRSRRGPTIRFFRVFLEIS